VHGAEVREVRFEEGQQLYSDQRWGPDGLVATFAQEMLIRVL
jgi:hypothetical protein